MYTFCAGNICKAAETKTVNVNGVPTLVTNFSVAENKFISGKQRTKYVRVSLWRDYGAKMVQYLKLGRSVNLQGEIESRAYLDKEGKPQSQLEMYNPQIHFNTANPKDEEETTVELPVEEDDLPM